MKNKTLLAAVVVGIAGYAIYRYTKTRSEVVTAKGEAREGVVEARQDAKTERTRIRQEGRTTRLKTIRDIIGQHGPHTEPATPGNTSTANKALLRASTQPLGWLSPSVLVGSAIMRGQPQTGAKSAPAQRARKLLQVTRRAAFPALGIASAASKTVRSVVKSRLRG